MADKMPGKTLRKPERSVKEKRAERRAKLHDVAGSTRKRKR